MSVDAIWDEMRQKETIDLASLQRKTKPKSKKKGLKFDHTTIGLLSQWNIPTEPASPSFKHSLVQNQVAAVAEPPLTQLDIIENIPMDCPIEFQKFLQRDINLLGEDAWTVRLASLDKLYRVISENHESFSADFLAVALEELSRPLIKRIKDDSEKCREKSIDLLAILFETAPDISFTLGYFFPAIITRLGCQDIDGVEGVPEIMRPSPEQKPMEITRFVEESEEIRLQIAKCIQILFSRVSQQLVLNFVDEMVAILRALAMDPFSEVKTVGMMTMQTFCYNHKDILLHFCPLMGRSLMSCLTNNLCRIRIEALQTMTAVLFTGAWKTAADVVQQLVAFQDPNMVPVKAFYEGVTTVNYMAQLTFDRHPGVRRFWFETMTYWLLKLPDHADHEPHLFAYMLSGLFDENDEIALEMFWLFEKLGEVYEVDNEKDIRNQKQYGFDQGWTYNGKVRVPFPLQGRLAFDRLPEKARGFHGPDLTGEELKQKQEGKIVEIEEDLGEEVVLPDRAYAWSDLRSIRVHRMLPRPRLGARFWVRSHVRKFIKALFNDVVDFRECTAINAAKLLSMVIAYSEENITEWIQPMFQALTKCFAGRANASTNKEVIAAYEVVCWQCGAFLEPTAYWEQIKPALLESSMLSPENRYSQLHMLAKLLEGSIYGLQSAGVEGLGRLKPIMSDLVETLCTTDLLDDSHAKVALREVLIAAKPVLKHVGNNEILIAALAISSSDEDLKEGDFETERFNDDTLVKQVEEAMGVKLSKVLQGEWWENCSFQSIRAASYLTPLKCLGDLSFLDQTTESLRLGSYIALKACRAGETKIAAQALQPTIQALRGLVEGKTKFSTATCSMQVLRRLSLKQSFYGGKDFTELFYTLIDVLADAELQKKIHKQMENVKRHELNKGPDEDFATLVAKKIREDSIVKTDLIRSLAGDIFLILFRRIHSRLSLEIRNECIDRLMVVLNPPEPKIEPLFLRPTPPAIMLLALEGILLCLSKKLPAATLIVEDAQRQVSNLNLETQDLIAVDKGQKLSEYCIMCMMSLNVPLPANPGAPPTPLTTADLQIKLGDDFGLSIPQSMDDIDDDVPQEILVTNPLREIHLLNDQGDECLKWNACLLLYKIAIMGGKLWPHVFFKSMSDWKNKKKEGRYQVAEDILRRIKL